MIIRVSAVLKRTVVGDTHPDDHAIRTTDTPGFKPFTLRHLSLEKPTYFGNIGITITCVFGKNSLKN